MTLGLSEPLKDVELMLILHGNMRFGLRKKLAGKRFATVSDLFDECVHVENTWNQLSYIPERNMTVQNISRPVNPSSRPVYPNPRPVHEISDNTASLQQTYTGMESFPNEDDGSSQTVCAYTSPNTFQSKPKFTQIPFPKHLLDKVQCWNCKMFGHF